ncbi:estrogen sulfotransferase-like isoform X1 [Ostrinia furnacalis]|uniref:estrogen sulfotransferase-like isoform X1 n=2 Tax=Ostrinia furnacalis TaxID=93504 RepID=UPI00103956D3|nr:estrogen sulfotransferase-like isoform X1 [Ostrinia furnacalis]
MSTPEYPYEIKDLGPEETAEAFKYFGNCTNMVDGLVRVGPKGYFFNSGMKKDAAPIYNMPIRSDDVFVVTFPKSGTTWVQELVWLIGNNFDYETAAAIPLIKRSPFLEHSSFCNGENTRNVLLEILKGDEKKIQFFKELLKPSYKMVEALPSPRFVKSHLPLSLLPLGLLRARVVYVARDPRDVAVSYYHHALLFKNYCFTGDFKNFWDYFRKDMLDWTPYFEHIKEAWDKRDHPNMLFLFYEELLEDLAGAVRRVAKFLGAPVSEEQVVRLCDHLSFHNFKNNKSVNFDVMREMGLMSEDGHFVRKGKAGGWREYFDEQMAAQAQQWIDDNLRGTDLRFPSGKK